MSRLGPQKSRQMKKVLRANGLVEYPSRGRGSHTWFEHPEDPRKATTVPSYEVIDRGLAHEIIEQAGKTVEEYLSHLR